jgi:predicted deacylase
MSTLQIGTLIAATGTKVNGFITVPNSPVQIPLTIINGAKAGKTLLITGGIHGAEYPCIESAIRFGASLDPQQMSGRVLIMSPVSLNSFHARQAFVVPEDGKNLNRQFPGKARGTIAERMAFTIMSEVVPHIDAWIDLHGGDLPEALIPFLGYEEAASPAVNAQTLDMAAAFGIELLVRPDHLAGTTVAAAAQLNIPCLLAEAGQLGQREESDIHLLQQGCHNVAQLMGIIPGTAPRTNLRIFENWPWVRAAHTGCWYPQVKIGDHVHKGQTVGVVKDYFGEQIAEYQSPADGIVLLVMTALSVNTNDPLLGVAAD